MASEWDALSGTERSVLFWMEMLAAEGMEEVTKKMLMQVSNFAKPTLISIFRDFVTYEWVIATETFTPGGFQNPTTYRLTPHAPSWRSAFDSLESCQC